jgi:CBS domain-containing protein
MIAKHYAKRVVTIPGHATAIEAARRMRAEQVGCLVVTNEDNVVVGILTDRDLTRRVIAHATRDGSVAVLEVMSSPPVFADANQPVHEVLELMGKHGVRRVPILREGRAVGLLSLDDLLQVVAMELHDLALGSACRRTAAAVLDRVDSRQERSTL